MNFSLEIAATLARLLAQEDTDGDKKITIEDHGPRAFSVQATDGSDHMIKGTYHLSNLLQELVIAQREGKQEVIIPLEKIEELPVARISRMIREYYWEGLTRTMDQDGIEALLSDSKNEQLAGDTLHIYVPYGDTMAWQYYTELAQQLPLKPIRLPEKITPEYVKRQNDASGILSLRLAQTDHGVKGVPFVVPGGRFNEMYGWDSYFESVGLLLDGKAHLAKAMADNFKYEIEHYGKILNANRSYYLTRTQPPFYSSLIREVFELTKDREWLGAHLRTAIKEYKTVWMAKGERLSEIGLNRYLSQGIGMPPEVEEGHFDSVLEPYAAALGVNLETYIDGYNSGNIIEPELDNYFVHDRTVRESGHDTSYRIEGKCADLVLVELNAMLYKYETDFAYLIKSYFGDHLVDGDYLYTAHYWLDKAATRKDLVDRYLWSEKDGFYLDYDLKKQQTNYFESVTAFIPMWAKMTSIEQAQSLVQNLLPKLKALGGLASCSKDSVGNLDDNLPQRQWDYPNGWAPHQMMVWQGLLHYGYKDEAHELIYRWLYMITRNAVDYNGTIPEKYDVVAATHKVFAEYGNVGTDFEYITTEGFGWMNASYQLGLSLLPKKELELLDRLTPPNSIYAL
ncbi:MAG: trehalase family glycosidase [Gilvibacter sp.]